MNITEEKVKMWPRRPRGFTAFIPSVVTSLLLSTTNNQKCSNIRRKQELCLKPSPHYMFLPFHLIPQPSVACWQLVVPKMSHTEDSNNSNSLFPVSITSPQAPQELCFHLWLLWTPVTAGSAGRRKSLHSSLCSYPSFQRMKKIPRYHFSCTDTGL